MSYQRLAYDDHASTSEMVTDCRAIEVALDLPRARTAAERTARAAVQPLPSLRYDDYPREVPKRDLTVDEAAARLGAALDQHLH